MAGSEAETLDFIKVNMKRSASVQIFVHCRTRFCPKARSLKRVTSCDVGGNVKMRWHMRAEPVPAYRRVGRAVKIAGACLALLCLLASAAFAALVQASVEERIAALFLFGLVPALGLYVGGCVLSRTVLFACRACELTMMGVLAGILALAHPLKRLTRRRDSEPF
jgi:hypothetical protein